MPEADVHRRQLCEHGFPDKWFRLERNSRPVWQVNTKAWRKALARAGVEDFRWHDLRHSWASYHAQSGTPLNVLQEMGGWCSHEMVLRCSHLLASRFLIHAERISESVRPETRVPPLPLCRLRTPRVTAPGKTAFLHHRPSLMP